MKRYYLPNKYTRTQQITNILLSFGHILDLDCRFMAGGENQQYRKIIPLNNCISSIYQNDFQLYQPHIKSLCNTEPFKKKKGQHRSLQLDLLNSFQPFATVAHLIDQHCIETNHTILFFRSENKILLMSYRYRNSPFVLSKYPSKLFGQVFFQEKEA